MLNQISFPKSKSYRSGSEFEPLKFYLDCLSNSKEFDLLLGYFSSAAINVLSLGFARFIYNEGKMRIIANHILSEKDKAAIIAGKNKDVQIPFDLEDIKSIRDGLDEYGEHFFKCLAYLIANDRIEIKIVKPKSKGIAHYKDGIFRDGNDSLSFHASCNFTAFGLLENAESLNCFLTSDGEASRYKIKEDQIYFDEIFDEKAALLEYLDVDSISTIIKDEFYNGYDLKELLVEEVDLIRKKNEIFSNDLLASYINDLEFELEKMSNKPKFPYVTGAMDYQIEAYNNWVKNGYAGLFAMATGTGKTITALNCVLNLFNQIQTYHFMILVPSVALLNQWESEVLKFNFKNILKVGGGNIWEMAFADYCSNYKYGIKPNLCIIAVNDTFASAKFQKYYKYIAKTFLFIADEAHNLGSNSFVDILQKINPEKRIGLSATPKRVYDPKGTDFLNSFFKDHEPYCYNFSMARALEENRLTNYYYYPKIVQLDSEEQEEYNKISRELLKYFDFENIKFKDNPIVETLLLKRKRIIHKAKGKLSIFKEILKELKDKNKLKYVFAYVPEGFDAYGEESNLLYQFLKEAHRFDPNLKLSSYTAKDANHSDILFEFEKGIINIIFAMKMLDEGVDVPRTEIGIFASSTGNPRQYIQRRGRLLRNHKDKAFATIYDMVVIPRKNDIDPSLYNIERNLLRTELNRVAYFASLAINAKYTINELKDICTIYDLDVNILIQEIKE
ncbi:DEAD/DEAH box helicase family protein [Pedobacter ginsengisoli]|uniref:DEAD/DEAH box helicase family protein n=1 Tax=Pedobacter ginsengisoli TaxID=363852 RepID=UPI00254A8311|nr:DEAD/DEAH box helicase family protein [Pedobacter ginsengisoli]